MKTFLSEQCKELEENNRMGTTRELFKKVRDTKVRFHAKMGTLKDRNGMDLAEAKDIKRWQEYTEELCVLIQKKIQNIYKIYKIQNTQKKILMTKITMMV